MEKFTFRLQKVLDHRARIEETKKQEFAKSRHLYIEEKVELDSLEGKLNEFVCRDTPQRSSPLFYLAGYNYVTAMEDKIEDQEKKVAICKENMDKKMDEFNESRKGRRVIEKLKENAWNSFNTEMDRKEQKQNDEFALYRYVRR